MDIIRDGLTDERTIIKLFGEGLKALGSNYSNKKLSVIVLLPAEYPNTNDTSDVHIQITDLRANSENKFASGDYIKSVDHVFVFDVKVRKTKNPLVHSNELIKRIRELMENLKISGKFYIKADMKVSLGLDGDMYVVRLRYVINYNTVFIGE